MDNLFKVKLKSLKANLWILWQVIFNQTSTQSPFKNSWWTESREVCRMWKNLQFKRQFEDTSSTLLKRRKIQMPLLPNEISLQECIENSFSSGTQSRTRIWMFYLWNTIYAQEKLHKDSGSSDRPAQTDRRSQAGVHYRHLSTMIHDKAYETTWR